MLGCTQRSCWRRRTVQRCRCESDVLSGPGKLSHGGTQAHACVCIRYRRYLRYRRYYTTDRYTILYAITSFPTKRLEVWKCHRSVSRNIPSERPSKAQQNGFLRDFLRLCCAIKLRNRPAKISGNAAATTLTSALTQRLRFPEAKKVTPVVPIGPRRGNECRRTLSTTFPASAAFSGTDSLAPMLWILGAFALC